MSNHIQSHYQRLASIYDDLWIYSPEFVKFLAEKMIEFLDLKPGDRFVDLGCGTGIYAQAILQKIAFNQPILCVDASENMLAKILADQKGLQILCQDASIWAAETGNYDKILIKELIHHIADQTSLINNLFKKVNKGGKVLLLMLPPKIDYPLFTQALKVYEQNQPHYQAIAQFFTESGFAVKTDFVEYPLAIPKSKYFEMVANRYMSLLSRFSDRELQAGLAEMTQNYANQSILEFKDCFVFITAQKP